MCDYCHLDHSVDEICFEKLRNLFHLGRVSLSETEQQILEVEEAITRLETLIHERRDFVALWLAKATSGEYRLHKIQQGQKSDDPEKQWRDLTDEEKLKDCFRTAEHHLEFIRSSSESLINYKKTLSMLKMLLEFKSSK